MQKISRCKQRNGGDSTDPIGKPLVTKALKINVLSWHLQQREIFDGHRVPVLAGLTAGHRSLHHDSRNGHVQEPSCDLQRGELKAIK